jgi:hypothetical protein
LKKVDANTKYFQIMATMRKRRKFIQSLQTSEGMAPSQQDKHSALFQHFNNHFRTYVPRQISLNFSNLGWQPRNLSHLDYPFLEHEVATMIKDAPKEKAPGLDGFIGLFFCVCWNIIKDDIMQAVEQFSNQNQQGLHLLNQVILFLL